MRSSSASTLPFLAGGGEMGRRIRDFEWSGHALGPAHLWPQSLKTAISLILTSQHPMWIGWGPELSFLYNDAYLHVLGTAKHEWALGRPAGEVWAEIWDVCGPLAEKVLRHGEASFVDDVRLFMNRGQFLEETWYSFSYSPIRDESGEIGGLFCPSTDVTPKVIGARRLRTLAELSSNALVEKTIMGACRTAAATLSKNRDDLPFALLYLRDHSQASLAELIHLGCAGEFLTPERVDLDAPLGSAWPIAEVVRSGQPRCVALHGGEYGALPEGLEGQRVQEAMVLPIASRSESNIAGVLIAGVSPARRLDNDYQMFLELAASYIGTAIQNARAAEDERRRVDALAALDRAKTVFFSNVSHEFRTPLTLLLGPLEQTMASPALGEADRERLATAHRNSLRLLKLVNSLLDFSRIEAGRVQATYEAVDLAAYTRDLASNFRATMEAAGLQYNVHCPQLPQRVYVDREMWEKIVLNLLSNAFKFTFEGSVTVAVEASATHVLLSVTDTGTGIPECELPRLFERFHRVAGARGRTYEGTGIGLALIQELVKLHGGTVSVESRLGQGSRFTVSIPFGSEHLPQGRIANAAAPDGMRTRTFTEEAAGWLTPETPAVPVAAPARPRIVLADDNADMRVHVQRILEPIAEVVAVSNGRAALEEVRRQKPDLLLSDIMMPALDGFGLLAELRRDPSLSTLSVILLSARAGEEARSDGMLAGADDYLVKPFSARELTALVTAHLKLAQARREADERAATILESITDAFAAFDQNWRYTYVNAEFERLWPGYPRGVLLGSNHWETFPQARGAVLETELRRAMTLRVAVEFDNYDASTDRWFHTKAFPSPAGGLSVFFEEITGRKRAEEALLRSEHRFRAFVTSTSDAVYRMSADWREMRQLDGKAFLPDTRRSSVSWLDRYIPYEERARVTAAIRQAVETRSVFELEHRVVRADGSIGWTFSRAVPLLQEDGTIREWFGTARDITRERESQLALREAEDRMRRLDQEQNLVLEQIAAGVPLEESLRELTRAVARLAPGCQACVLVGEAGSDTVGECYSATLAPETGAGVLLTDAPTRLGFARTLPVFFENDTIPACFCLCLPEGQPTNWERRLADFGAHAAGLALQRHQAEDRVRQSHRALAELVQRAPFGLYIVDSDFRLAHANPRTLAGAFRNVQPAIGRDFGEVMRAIWPEPLATELIGLFRRTLETGEPYISSDFVSPRQDIEATEAYEWEIHRMVLPDGQFGVVCYYFDSTRVRTVEAALRESEERLRLATETGKVGVWDWDLTSGKITWTDSLYDVHGIDKATFPNTLEAYQSLVHPDDREMTEKAMARAIAEDVPYEVTRRAIRPDGSIIWLYSHAKVLRREVRPVRMLGATLDVTALKRVEEELRHANQDLEQFAYSASHDLQEPLRSVKIYSELVRKRYAQHFDEQGLLFLEYIGTGATRMETLISDLLTYTRATQLEGPTGHAAASEALRFALDGLSKAIAESGASIQLGALPSLPVHRTHLQLLFQNLVGNAIKYRRDGEPLAIRLAATRQSQGWLFSVEDNGIGIEPAYHERIFGIFKRLHSSSKYPGTGIGLAICQRIVERYNGRIWVTSEPGKGSTFYFTLPA
ncbi:MAG: PAS domain-containing protein [Bryobacterales bacterium]|nr:PAS domain-containing protein [Bryobacterales bacterium]